MKDYRSLAKNFGTNWPSDLISSIHQTRCQYGQADAPLHDCNSLQNWLAEARDMLIGLQPDELANLPIEARRSLAAASLQFWQARVGTTGVDARNTDGDFSSAKQRVDNYVHENGIDDLIGDLNLATKALTALMRSPLYNSLIERTADRIIDGYVNDYMDGAPWGGSTVLQTVMVMTQAQVWMEAAYEDCEDLSLFKIVTEKADLRPDCYLPQSDGTGLMYMGPEPDGSPHWLNGNSRQQVWLIAHEHLHHIQYHLYQRYSAGTLQNSQLRNDIQAMVFNIDFSVPHFVDDIFGNSDCDNPRFPLWLAAHHALYLSKPNEAAAFKLHNAIINGLTERLGPATIPEQPQKPTPKPLTARPSPAPR